MKCPKCKRGKLEYYPDNYYVGCPKCDYRNGSVPLILKVRGRKPVKVKCKHKWGHEVVFGVQITDWCSKCGTLRRTRGKYWERPRRYIYLRPKEGAAR